ncbi:aromatic acid decarboxylase [Alcanivorax sp. HI0033]|jgi:flavin prenyltransferase|uniref:flavin prenyltransferase UbiX n=1 Tax=unclassified Alcanivorax TaxID=2638842 RepID=UPI000789F42E|nr:MULTISPECIES: flavin prenyltransferase UbiX [unclassified Alcanivorax]KZX74123.1 aromatic acid decarboxylase [Alcanivorax sp. HI0013]KZX74634.1 aromatic acid decarboxylase [Alcanivorax sp. HI0011]KZY26625.1 aromatic acid decarboxylase [Alcanivorax sp. HI0035]KZX67119.1 aromatic acid decarboxylase [Alcanivorax sp. HI0007]KZX70053.1 aromatic acid decarboxylase [Alcanivorax sp. HI0003]
MRKRITLAFTGASGAPYGLRLLQCLLDADCEVFVILSKAARVVIGMETELKLPAGTGAAEQALRDWVQTDRGNLVVCGLEQWTAPVASGSGAPAAMVVCPCSTGTLSAIACGASDNLIERAADVAIKEGRKLILVPREAPFSPLHLENMLKLSRLGVTIMPAAPGFYHQPETVQDLVDFIVARLLDHLGVEQTLVKRWGE